MIEITVNPKDVLQKLDAFTERQLPFATARGLTSLAQATNDRSRSMLGQRFTIRSNWTAKGYRVERATKANLVATSYHLDPMMALQELGGAKKGQGSRSVAVPLAARPTPQAVTKPSTWPGAVIRSKRAFRVKTKGGDVLILQRTGRRKKRQRNAQGQFIASGKRRRALGPVRFRFAGEQDPNVRILWMMKRAVQLKPRLHYRDDAATVTQTQWKDIMEGALADALRTAR